MENVEKHKVNIEKFEKQGLVKKYNKKSWKTLLAEWKAIEYWRSTSMFLEELKKRRNKKKL